MSRRIAWEDAFKFLAGISFAKVVPLFYHYVDKSPMPIPQVGVAHFTQLTIFFFIFAYLGFIRKWKQPFAK